jgi:hypothetical protein
LDFAHGWLGGRLAGEDPRSLCGGEKRLLVGVDRRLVLGFDLVAVAPLPVVVLVVVDGFGDDGGFRGDVVVCWVVDVVDVRSVLVVVGLFVVVCEGGGVSGDLAEGIGVLAVECVENVLGDGVR